MEFYYKAKDTGGNIIEGSIEAESRAKVADAVTRNGYVILSIEQQSLANKSIKFELPFKRKVKVKDFYIFSRQLASMLRAGIPLLKALKILAKQTTNKRLRESIIDIIFELETGSTFYEAVEKHGDIFSPIFVSMVY